MQAGDIEGFGYEQSVMLMARVTPPVGYSGSAQIGAQARWLACNEICVPGKATLGTTVQVGSSSTFANRETFAQWLKRIPMDLGSSPLQVSIRRAGLTYELTVTGVPKDAMLDVAVDPPDGVKVRRVVRRADSATIEFTRLGGLKVTGSAEVVIGKADRHVRVLLPLE
jgi:thiol:disulfide interchange protein DsbD